MSIEGLAGREPVGAVLTVGHKAPSGNPEHTDRFYLVQPQEVDGVRAPHPAFAAFNTADVARRQVIRGNLVHSTVAECFEYNLRAQNLPGIPAHPSRGPHCIGDGIKAKRWNGEKYIDIDCPNEKCQFRAEVHPGKPIPCKPSMRLMFRVRWTEGSPLPPMVVKFTSQAWNTTKNLLGMLEHIEKNAKALGIDNFSLYGFPFMLTLTKKKRSGDAKTARSFPVVTATPELDIVTFLRQQQSDLVGIRPQVTSLLDPSQRALEVQAEDVKTITPAVIDI